MYIKELRLKNFRCFGSVEEGNSRQILAHKM